MEITRSQILVNQLMPNGISHLYQLDEPILKFKDCWVVINILIHILKVHTLSKKW